MKCLRCLRTIGDHVARCECGYEFGNVSPEALPGWYAEYRQLIEKYYLEPGRTPWQQSGKGGTFEDWTRLRIPISECISAPGSFLDIGCANGFLLECLLDWTSMKGVEIVPYGLDFSPPLIEMARTRLPQFKNNMYIGNALDWQPPMRYDYVRTNIEFVPHNYHTAYLNRLRNDFLSERGILIIAQYRSSLEDLSTDWIDDYLKSLGYSIEKTTYGFDERGREKTRIAVI